MLKTIKLALALLALQVVVACGGTVGVEPGGTAGAGAGPAAQGGAPGSAGTPPLPSAGSGNSGNVGNSPGGASGSMGTAGEASATGTCVVGGVRYAIGERFACDCNTCSCDTDGTISTTLIACEQDCQYAGKTYVVGETFPDKDGCNQCSCHEFGEVSCTEKFCGCHPDQEWYRHYLSLSAAKCALIDYECPANTVAFSADCGCGCEQDSACPQWIDCEPGANNGCELLKAQCPFSQVAY